MAFGIKFSQSRLPGEFQEHYEVGTDTDKLEKVPSKDCTFH